MSPQLRVFAVLPGLKVSPVPRPSGSQSPVTPAPGDSQQSSDVYRHQYGYTYTHIKRNKIYFLILFLTLYMMKKMNENVKYLDMKSKDFYPGHIFNLMR